MGKSSNWRRESKDCYKWKNIVEEATELQRHGIGQDYNIKSPVNPRKKANSQNQCNTTFQSLRCTSQTHVAAGPGYVISLIRHGVFRDITLQGRLMNLILTLRQYFMNTRHNIGTVAAYFTSQQLYSYLSMQNVDGRYLHIENILHNNIIAEYASC